MAVGMGIGRFVYTPLLPGMMQGLGLSASDAGLIASANFAGYLGAALVAGGGWGEGRERAVSLVALAANGVLLAAMAASDSLAAFLIVRMLAGIASAFVMVFVAAVVFARLAAAGRDDLQAVHFMGVGFGIAASAVMTGTLAWAGSSWQEGWLWSAAISAAGFAAVWLLLDSAPRPVAGPAAEPRLRLKRPLAALILAYGLFGFGYIVTATFLIAIVRQGEAGALFEAGVWLATGIAILPSIWLWGFLARARGLRVAFAVGCLAEILGVLASVTISAPAGPLLGGVLLGGTFVACTAFGLQAARRLAGPSPRRVFAIMTASFGLGQILGPIAAGVVADRTGDFVLASFLAAAALMLAAAFAFISRRLDTSG